MPNPPSPAVLSELETMLGPRGFTRDPQATEPWLTDWRRRYRGEAAAMLSPASSAEVAAIVRLCAAERVAIVPQGGNSSMVAGATPDPDGHSVLLSLRRMNRIRSLDADSGLAVCEAGVILADLHSAAAEARRRFPLSLAAKGSATVGGLVATNAGGTQVLRFGTMRGLVQGLEAVLPDGSLLEGLSPLRKDNRGYDLKQLLIGSEGTLGVVTAASLKLVPVIGARAVAWIGLRSPDQGLKLLRRLESALPDAVESFEIVPQSALALVLAHIPGTRAPLGEAYPWNALVEATAPEGAPEPALAEALGEALEGGLAEDAAIASSEAQAEALWRLRESISEAEQKDGPAAKHDVSVEVSAMPRFMAEAAAAVEARFAGTRVNAFGHLGDGNVHFNVRPPAGAGPGWLIDESPAVTAFVHDLVAAAGGSISAEHGIGQTKLAELERLGEPARLSAMRAIKRALDPLGIMNPGKLLSASTGQESLAESAVRP
ncbi:FAD-binding oxidoreductase [Allosphingosinicella sp.]|jgi:FAD/FMN-containing dehydrogenase|uniref:FAD-binding oxidoreductase n=1 Tax=Allosphingosinicella sp. TaxID=2823234 RepID=UPI002EE38626